MALIKIANLILLLLAGSTEVAQPLWWDKETSYYRKYGLGRKDLDAFGVVRNIWIYTKEFMMPKKLN